MKVDLGEIPPRFESPDRRARNLWCGVLEQWLHDLYRPCDQDASCVHCIAWWDLRQDDTMDRLCRVLRIKPARQTLLARRRRKHG